MRFSRTSSQHHQVEEVQITGLSHDGRGLARHQGRTVFVEGALEQEQVSLQVLRVHRKFIEARVRTVHSASAERCQPPCPYFGRCGGCSLQYWRHDGQLQGKQRIVQDQLRRFAGMVADEIAEPLRSEPYGYRHRCRLAMRWHRGQLQLGFRQMQSQAICDIQACQVLAPALQDLPELLRTLLLSLTAGPSISHGELFLAEQARAVLLRHIRPLETQDLARLQAWGKAHQLHLYLQDNNRQISCLHDINGRQRLYYSLPEAGLKMAFQPGEFTQVNQPVNQAMVAQAVQWLDVGENDRILDLYCGLGNFSLALARRAKQVTGVEGGAAAVARAKENAHINQLSNCTFLVANLDGDVTDQPWACQHYDGVVLDPPRAGAQGVIEALAGTWPDRVLYISCNPATLARDAGLLKARGFRLQRLGVMDMFPQTAHIESMTLFVR